jgi:hypothetical protein
MKGKSPTSESVLTQISKDQVVSRTTLEIYICKRYLRYSIKTPVFLPLTYGNDDRCLVLGYSVQQGLQPPRAALHVAV